MIRSVVSGLCQVPCTKLRSAVLLVFGLALAGASGSASAATVVEISNAAQISIPEGGLTSPYPSTIEVNSIAGNVITKVAVRLNDFSTSTSAGQECVQC